MRQILNNVVVFLVAAILFSWVGYHIVNYNSDVIETETIFEETISRSLTGRGIAIREEQTLQKTGSGAERVLYEDGTRVGIGQTIIEYYTGSVENRNIRSIYSYEEEILKLEEAQNKNVNNLSTAGIISRDIREQLANLSRIVSTGECNEIESLRKNLTELVNKRNIAIGESDNYNERIELLKQELQELKESGNLDQIQKGVTPVSGYFAKQCDGYENIISPAIIEDYLVEDYKKLINEQPEVEEENNKSGKIVTSSKWYFAITAPIHEIEWVKVGQGIELSFGHISKPVPGRVHRLIMENNNTDGVIIFSSDYISEDIVNLRTADVIVSFTKFSGLKIDTNNIRFAKNESGESIRGVFVLENHVARFRKIDTIYEEEDFVLSKTNYSDSQNKDYVKLYDNIIVNGTDIVDGKVVQ